MNKVNWIKCSDRMPEVSVPIIFYSKKHGLKFGRLERLYCKGEPIGYRFRELWELYDYELSSIHPSIYVTHWAEMIEELSE